MLCSCQSSDFLQKKGFLMKKASCLGDSLYILTLIIFLVKRFFEFFRTFFQKYQEIFTCLLCCEHRWFFPQYIDYAFHIKSLFAAKTKRLSNLFASAASFTIAAAMLGRLPRCRKYLTRITAFCYFPACRTTHFLVIPSDKFFKLFPALCASVL